MTVFYRDLDWYDTFTDEVATTDPWSDASPPRRLDFSRLAEARDGWLGSQAHDPRDDPDEWACPVCGASGGELREVRASGCPRGGECGMQR